MKISLPHSRSRVGQEVLNKVMHTRGNKLREAQVTQTYISLTCEQS